MTADDTPRAGRKEWIALAALALLDQADGIPATSSGHDFEEVPMQASD